MISLKQHLFIAEYRRYDAFNGTISSFKECASSALRIQAGESPAPVKPSKQPVHSLEAKAAR